LFSNKKAISTRIVLVGFLPDGHARSCKRHPYGCGNALLESQGNGVGSVVRLCLVEETNLPGYLVRDDGTDGCRVCLTAREYAIGPNACRLDSSLLKIMEVYLPNSANSSMRMLYHRNHGYAIVVTIVDYYLMRTKLNIDYKPN
jgi:hypothetical protein